MNTIVKAAGLLAALALSAGLALAQGSLPYSFSAGEPARASEVNANFQALATALAMPSLHRS